MFPFHITYGIQKFREDGLGTDEFENARSFKHGRNRIMRGRKQGLGRTKHGSGRGRGKKGGAAEEEGRQQEQEDSNPQKRKRFWQQQLLPCESEEYLTVK